MDYVPYGSVMVPKVQRTGQYVAPKGPNQGEMEYSTMYPGDVVLTRDTDLDNVYTSGQFEEVKLGELAQESEYDYTTPVMGESALVQAAQEAGSSILRTYLQRKSPRTSTRKETQELS